MDKEDWRFGTENIEDITDIEQAKRQLVEPFNLYGDRLFHIRLLRDSKSLYLFADYHHIIVDGNFLLLRMVSTCVSLSSQSLISRSNASDCC